MPSHPAVFVDKDGTLIENVPFNVDPARVVLAPGAGPALSALAAAGYQVVVVSNQPGVAEGRFPEAALAAVTARLRELLQPYGVSLLDVYYCIHEAASPPACGCRKPAPGLLRLAAEQHGLDLGRSWMIGDILDDVEAGHAAGCRSILVDSGGETEWRLSPGRVPDASVPTFSDAARVILPCRSDRATGGGTLVARGTEGGSR